MFLILNKKSNNKPTVAKLQAERAELNKKRREIFLSFSEDCELKEEPTHKKNGSIAGEPIIAIDK